MFGLGPWEIAGIFIVGLLLFGRRLPEVGRSVGKSIVEFKRGLKDVGEDLDREAMRDEERKRFSSTARPAISDGEDRRVSRSEPQEATVPTSASPASPAA